jgi:hypothetical protein
MITLGYYGNNILHGIRRFKPSADGTENRIDQRRPKDNGIIRKLGQLGVRSRRMALEHFT